MLPLDFSIFKKWEFHQMDIHNTFLHGDLEEEVYMSILPGFHVIGCDKTYRFRKSLYGLRQASRNWFVKFAFALHEYGFIQSGADHSLFTKSKETIFMTILVYVNNLILVCNDLGQC